MSENNNLSTLIQNQISDIPEIRELQIEQLQFEYDYRKAEALDASQIYSKKYKNKFEIFAILQEGRTLGFNSSESMNGLYLVGGGVQMYGSLKTSYLQKRGYKINFVDEKVENDKLVETTCIVTKNDEKYTAAVTVNQLKGGKNNPGLQNAPMTKVRYEAINRILKTQLSGSIPDIISRSEDDIIIEAKIVNKNEEVKKDDKKSEIITYIEEDVTTIEGLESVKNQIKTEEEHLVYEAKKAELQPKLEKTEVIEKPKLTIDIPPTEEETPADLLADISDEWEDVPNDEKFDDKNMIWMSEDQCNLLLKTIQSEGKSKKVETTIEKYSGKVIDGVKYMMSNKYRELIKEALEISK